MKFWWWMVAGRIMEILRLLYEIGSQVNFLPSGSFFKWSFKNYLSRFPCGPFGIMCCLYRKNTITYFGDLHPKTKTAHDTASKSSFIYRASITLLRCSQHSEHHRKKYPITHNWWAIEHFWNAAVKQHHITFQRCWELAVTPPTEEQMGRDSEHCTAGGQVCRMPGSFQSTTSQQHRYNTFGLL